MFFFFSSFSYLLLIALARVGCRCFGLIDQCCDRFGARLGCCQQTLGGLCVLRSGNSFGRRHELVGRERNRLGGFDNIFAVAHIGFHLGNGGHQHVVGSIKVIGVDKLKDRKVDKGRCYLSVVFVYFGVLLCIVGSFHQSFDGFRNIFGRA